MWANLVLLLLASLELAAARPMGGARTDGLHNAARSVADDSDVDLAEDDDLASFDTDWSSAARSLLDTSGTPTPVCGFPKSYGVSGGQYGPQHTYPLGVGEDDSDTYSETVMVDLQFIVATQQLQIYAKFTAKYRPTYNRSYFQFWIFQSAAAKDEWLATKANNCEPTRDGLFWFVKWKNTTALSTLPENSTVSFPDRYFAYDDWPEYAKSNRDLIIRVPIRSPSLPWTWGQTDTAFCSHLGQQGPAYLAFRIYNLDKLNVSAAPGTCKDAVHAKDGLLPFTLSCTCPPSPSYPPNPPYSPVPPPRPPPASPSPPLPKPPPTPPGIREGTFAIILYPFQPDTQAAGFNLNNVTRDDGYGYTNLPWPFTIFCQTFTQVVASANGYLTFKNASTNFANPGDFASIESLPIFPAGMIGAFVDDLQLQTLNSLTWITGHDDHGEYFTVRWATNVEREDLSADQTQYPRSKHPTINIKFQATLYRDGKIALAYKDNNAIGATDLAYFDYALLDTNGIQTPVSYAPAKAGLRRPNSDPTINIPYNITAAASVSSTACAVFVPQPLPNNTCATADYVLHASTNGCVFA